MKTGYPHGFQGLHHCIEKRSDTPGSFLNNHNIEQMKELENALLLCRTSIIHNQNKIQAAHNNAAAATTATNATSKISNTSSTSTATAPDSAISSSINAYKITVCSESTPPSSGLTSSSFPLYNDKLRASLNINCLSNKM